MATCPERWLKQLHSCMRKLKAAVTSVSVTRSQSLPLTTQTPLLRMLNGTLTRICISYGNTPDAPSPDLQPEYVLFVTDFSELLASLVQALTKLGSALNSTTAGHSDQHTQQADIFWEVWETLIAACSAYDWVGQKLQALSQSDQQRPVYAVLYPAFQSLLTWLLAMSRSPAWDLMQLQHGMTHRNQDLIHILIPPTQCLLRISMASSRSTLLHHLDLLPQGFLPLLCCIVSEQLSDTPRLVPPDQLQAAAAVLSATTNTQGLTRVHSPPLSSRQPFCHMVATISNLHKHADRITGNIGPHTFLTSPAILHFLKGIVLPLGQTPETTPVQLQRSINCLQVVLSTTLQCAQRSRNPPLSSIDQSANRDALGLPIHANPLLSTAALDTDRQLLNTLTRHLTGDVRLSVQCGEILTVLLQSWMLAGEAYPGPHAAVPLMIISAVGLAKGCTAYGLRTMQLYAQTGKKEGGQLGSEIELGGLQGFRSIRHLMYATSTFLAHIDRGGVQQQIGELCECLNTMCVDFALFVCTRATCLAFYTSIRLSCVRALSCSLSRYGVKS